MTYGGKVILIIASDVTCQGSRRCHVFQDTANERSEAVFRMLDKDDDGELDEEEFVAGCLRDERLRSLLNSGDGDWKK